MKIDWSKAPEGFPVWIEGVGVFSRVRGRWHRDAGDEGWQDQDGRFWQKDAEERGNCKVYRPQPWDGTGLPSVGVVCELRTKVGGWGEAEIKYHGPAICVWLWVRRDGNTAQIEFAENPERLEFRPIRTPWQIAAEEREAAAIDIKRAVEAGPYTRYGISHDAALAIYDAGYRKTEGAK